MDFILMAANDGYAFDKTINNTVVHLYCAFLHMMIKGAEAVIVQVYYPPAQKNYGG